MRRCRRRGRGHCRAGRWDLLDRILRRASVSGDRGTPPRGPRPAGGGLARPRDRSSVHRAPGSVGRGRHSWGRAGGAGSGFALRAVPRRDQIQRAQSTLFRAPVVAEARRARASVRRLGRRPREAAWAPVRPRPVHRRAGANRRLAGSTPVKLGQVTARSHEILGALARVIVGKGDVLERILAGILANGHVLIEDYPGLAKTLIARLFAQALGLSFKRLQCTPDLLPADVTGSFLFDQRQARFEFRPGPVSTNFLLADEINRATPKTQAALLEAMQEAQVTVEGESFRLEPPFLVIATQNPIEMEGTYPLPEAQLDRFLIRVAVGYPSADEERQILERRRQRRQDEAQVPAVVSRDEILAMQRTLEDVSVSAGVERYVVDLVQATRSDHRVALGASPRGALALLKLARAWAALRGRDFVTPDDVKAMAGSALAHRLILQPELWVSKLSAAQVVNDLLTQVPVPKAEVC